MTSYWQDRWHWRSCGQSFKAQRGRAIIGDGHIRKGLIEALPFALTASQAQALREIEADMAAPQRMLRLLQGDVGSGKTALAVMSMAIAVEAGAQAALMAPTEVLARQHAETIAPLADKVDCALAARRRENGQPRTELLSRLAKRRDRHLIGTHRALPAHVVFQGLASVTTCSNRSACTSGALADKAARRRDVLVDDATRYGHAAESTRRSRRLAADREAGRA